VRNWRDIPHAIHAVFLSHTGVLVGVILRYAIPGDQPDEYFLAELSENCSNLSSVFEVGQTIQINTRTDNFTCSVSGKVFKDDQGNAIRSTVREGE
jgi:hypothetical protein